MKQKIISILISRRKYLIINKIKNKDFLIKQFILKLLMKKIVMIINILNNNKTSLILSKNIQN